MPSTTSEPSSLFRKLPRLTLASLMLLVSLTCIATAWWQLRIKNHHLQTEIDIAKQLSPVLEVQNTSHYAALRRVPTWWREAKWDVYLPPGNTYRICLACDEITGDVSQMPPRVRGTHEITAGQYVFELTLDIDDDASSVEVLVDNQAVIRFSESSDWNPLGSSFGGGVAR